MYVSCMMKYIYPAVPGWRWDRGRLRQEEAVERTILQRTEYTVIIISFHLVNVDYGSGGLRPTPVRAALAQNKKLTPHYAVKRKPISSAVGRALQ